MKTVIGAACFACVLFAPGRTPGRAKSIVPPTGAASVMASQRDVLDASALWLVPSPQSAARRTSADTAQFVKGVQLYGEGRYGAARRLLNPDAFAGTDLFAYVSYFKALADIELDSIAAARDTLDAIVKSEPVGYLAEAAPLRHAEAAEEAHDYAAAVRIYTSLSQKKTSAPDDVLLRLARAAVKAGDTEAAATAYVRVFYEFPMSDAAASAGSEMKKLDLQPIAANNARYKLELGRGERLFGARRYGDAKKSLELVQPFASGDEKELVDLRLAESDYYLGRYRPAAVALRPHVQTAKRKAEALFFYASALRALGDQDNYVMLSRQIVDQFADSTWAEESLNNLGSYYIRTNDDEAAARVFAELYQRYPDSRYGDRAAWKAGWWAFKHANYEEAFRVFTDAAVRFPHSDTRSAFQYWTARALEKLGRTADSRAAFAAVTHAYGSSYYGRLAAPKAAGASSVVLASTDQGPAFDPGAPPASAGLIRQLLSLKLYDLAIDELQYAQRVWGGSPMIDATLGWIYNQQGDLRRGINAMKRAYPTYISAAGQLLPAELLKIFFPLNYWDLIQKQATAKGLDPYLIAALMAQESTFTPDIKSSVGAVGLMQIMPSTGRQLARTLKIPRYRVSMLTKPEINIQMGTHLFAALTKRFGGAPFALASYNAGDHRVARWRAERPGIEEDEFIDDIPFPETQNYVKKILGTAEDYRIIYGGKRAQAARLRVNGS